MSAAQRRAALLDAALEVFAQRGFTEASLDDVAARGGVSKALIYEHFATKRDLQRALLEGFMHEALDAVATAFSAAQGTEARLRDSVGAFLGFVEARPEAWRMVGRNIGDPDAAEVVARLQDEVTAAVAALLEQEAPALDPTPEGHRSAVEIIARLISGGLQSLATWWVDHPDVARAELVDRVLQVWWPGLERVSRRAG
jgi:AcrR family transcriptional regulator